MESFGGKLAVVTGGGSGMGRELVLQLAAEGASVATCDLNADAVAETAELAAKEAPTGSRISTHICDVSKESDVERFRDEVVEQHGTDHINLLFNNAGIGGGGSFLTSSREEWERTFGVCWGGVYLCSRAFVPLLVASDEGHLINTSSVNGFWASLGPGTPHTAYSAAKFAVKGFSEALLEDFRVNAPHVSVSVVMPGHIGTDIVINSRRAHGGGDPDAMTDEEVDEVRGNLAQRGLPAANMPADDIRKMIKMMGEGFRDNAPCQPRKPRPSSSTAFGRVSGASWWATMPTRSTSAFARILRRRTGRRASGSGPSPAVDRPPRPSCHPSSVRIARGEMTRRRGLMGHERVRIAAGVAAAVWVVPAPALAHFGRCTGAETATTVAIAAAVVAAVIRPWRKSRSNGRRRVPAIAASFAVVAALTLAGCGGSSQSPSTSTTVTRPVTTARLQIVRPMANQETGPDVTLEVKLIGGEVVPQTTGKLNPTQGHIHVSLDGQLVSMAYQTTQDLHGVGPGTHTLQAEFVAIDHKPFKNRVIAAVIFTVKA